MSADKPKSKKKSLKTSRFSRILKVGSTLAKASGYYAIDKIEEYGHKLKQDAEEKLSGQRVKIKAIQEIVQSLGELKGGLMKIGQMLSITEDLLLPKEVSDLFSKLQNTAPSMPQKDLLSVFEKSFQKRPEEIFKEFNYDPFAAASIGQVHEGVLKSGEKVAIKVQYPKIVKAIKNDLKNLDQINKLFSMLLPQTPNIANILEEIRDGLVKETYYKTEAKEMIKFKEMLGEEFPEIVVPRVYEEYSNSQIITMEFMEGDTFEETLDYSQEEKDHLGSLFYNSFLYTFFQKRKLHSDPQYGNFLFRPGKVILLDFGSTRTFDKTFVNHYALMNHAIEIDDVELFNHAATYLGLAHPDDSEEHFQKTYEFACKIYHPYLEPGKYRVEDLNPFKIFHNFFMSIDLKGRKSPRQEFFLLDRSLLGLFTKLKHWNSQVDWEYGRKKYRYPVSSKAYEDYLKENSS